MESSRISIETTRYSAFFRRLLQEYSEGTAAIIDGQRHSALEYPDLVKNWCTNARIKGTNEFRLLRGDAELFGFHDHPDELWAACSELSFVERVAEEGIVRYRVLPARPEQSGWLQRVIVLLMAGALFAIIRLLSWLF